ncbi:MAG: biotin/lipoyl-containing protein, partial [Ktedonobacteraceae bacterium]
MKTVEMPKMGDTMEEGKILRWIKREGDTVERGESIAEVETDKVNIEIQAFASGILRKILVSEGESAPINAGIAYIGAVDEPLPDQARDTGKNGKKSAAPKGQEKSPTSAPAPKEQKEFATTVAGPGKRIFISPLARRFAEEYKL